MTSPQHPKSLEIIAMIEDLKIPPPPPLPKFLAPPPPPPPTLESVTPPPKDANRSAMFDELTKKTQGKALNKRAIVNDRQNRVAKEGWWKQNYAYELQLPVAPAKKAASTPTRR